jgi:hypothetical protein
MSKPITPAAVLTAIALAMTVTCTGYTFAADPEQSAPQGEDPPGADQGGADTPPPSEHKGVIPPPNIGDEGIHTEVPNPDAGTEEEVIPPPDQPGAEPDLDRR